MPAPHTIARPIVIGGTGFIGGHVVRALLGRGVPVRVTQRGAGGARRLEGLDVTRVAASLNDPASIALAVRGCDTVFFAAGHSPTFSLDAPREIAIGLARLRAAIDAARTAGVGRFVYTSSFATIGPAPAGRAANEQDLWQRPPRGSVYHAVKLALEREVLEASAKGLPAVLVCPTGCIGEGDVNVGSCFFVMDVASERLRFYVEGETNVVDVAVVAAAQVRAAEVGRIGARYVLGGVNLTIGELLHRTAATLGVPLRARRVPAWVAAALCTLDEVQASRRRGRRWLFPREYVDHARLGRFVDTTRARSELDLGETDLEAVLRRAHCWFVAHGIDAEPSRRG